MKRLLMIIAFLLYAAPVQAKGLELFSPPDRDVYIEGAIDDSTANDATKKLRELDKDKGEITVYINSPGGDVQAGLAIIDTMHSVKAKVRTVCLANCMSMAAFILASGDRREALPNATIMIHGIASELAGKLPQIKNGLAEIQRLQDIIDTLMAKAMHKTVAEYQAMTTYDHYLSAPDAIKAGLVDGLVKSGK